MSGSGDRRRERDDHRSYEEESRHRHRARSSSERRDRDDDHRRYEEENGRDRHRDRARSDYQDRRRERDEVRPGSYEESKAPRPEEGREPELYAICRGRVHSIKPFGIFVRLDEYRCQGLVHISQVSSYEVSKRDDPDEAKVQAMLAIYGVGEAVWVKIISVKREGGSVKIGCSLKHVAQSDGRDLDPNNLQLQQQESRPERQERQKTSLGAVYDVVCPRCGGHGHLKNECYSTGDKVYELVPEVEDDDADRLVPQPQAVVAAASSEPQVHRKRERLPDNVSTVEEAKELIARLKAEKKEKKRLRKEDKRHKKTKKSRS